MSDSDGNFVSEKFKKEILINLNTTEPAVLSSYNHQSNGEVATCIKFIKWMLKKFFDTNANTFLGLFQVRSTPLGPGL